MSRETAIAQLMEELWEILGVCDLLVPDLVALDVVKQKRVGSILLEMAQLREKAS